MTLDNKLIFDKDFRKNRHERRIANKFIGSLSKRLYKVLVFTIASIGLTTKRAYANIDDGLTRTDMFGQELLTIIQRVGFWIAVLGCLIEILVSVFKKGGGHKEIINIIFKWLLIFASFYIVPALFKYIIHFFE